MCLTYRDVDTIESRDKRHMTDKENEAVVREIVIDCFVAPTTILKPKAARDKRVETVLCIDTSRVTKRAFGWHRVAILLCGVCARVCVTRCRIIYRNTNTLNGIKIDSTIFFFSASWQKCKKSAVCLTLTVSFHCESILNAKDHDITRNTFRSVRVSSK